MLFATQPIPKSEEIDAEELLSFYHKISQTSVLCSLLTQSPFFTAAGWKLECARRSLRDVCKLQMSIATQSTRDMLTSACVMWQLSPTSLDETTTLLALGWVVG